METKLDFIEEAKLGLLAMQVLAVFNGGPRLNKRDRKQEFNRFASVLKGLGLIPSKATIKGISYGLTAAGISGLFVSYELPTVVHAELPR